MYNVCIRTYVRTGNAGLLEDYSRRLKDYRSILYSGPISRIDEFYFSLLVILNDLFTLSILHAPFDINFYERFFLDTESFLVSIFFISLLRIVFCILGSIFKNINKMFPLTD